MSTATKPSLFGRLAGLFRFGAYAAADEDHRRKSVSSSLLSEDSHLPPEKRRRLVANGRDLARNFSIAAWMIRKHLDFVSSFRFQPSTQDEQFNQRLQAFVAKWGRRKNCDVAGRHTLRRMLRLAEARRVVDGDVFLLKLRDGRLQAIEGDRIRRPVLGLPAGLQADQWAHGVQTDKAGRALRYMLCQRTSSGFQYERTLQARNVAQLAYYDRFDQTRGISPLASALNPLRDTYEGYGYALAKAKLSQLFGLVIYRDSLEQVTNTDDTRAAEDEGETGSELDDELEEDRYDMSLSDGPWKLELDPKDRAEFFETKSPPTELQQFMTVMVLTALKALDLPFSFFDESFTNFYGSRGGVQQYLSSCKSKREDLAETLDELTAWRITLAIIDGELELPADWTLENVTWDWIPAGLPWWDKLKEAKGALEMIALGLSSPQAECQEIGRDFLTNIKQTAEAVQIAADYKLALSFMEKMALDLEALKK